jgi:hypothetical protein
LTPGFLGYLTSSSIFAFASQGPGTSPKNRGQKIADQIAHLGRRRAASRSCASLEKCPPSEFFGRLSPRCYGVTSSSGASAFPGILVSPQETGLNGLHCATRARAPFLQVVGGTPVRFLGRWSIFLVFPRSSEFRGTGLVHECSQAWPNQVSRCRLIRHVEAK